ncbi:short-chain dehydrogenase/reductase [Campylobacter lari]|uniref:SDR family NAD(P)-dependent oxidoreductase n=1 Tax=Campylobacter lari TaxID=201 RepID=UPI002152E3A2|nr:SDR family oxidoreductase [Campylobacter lari]MCR6549941.1 SDR family oxidoreductase [Campylobacter lari]MCV3458280.1 SDR family oxidoreductase [Campylobacter lari]
MIFKENLFKDKSYVITGASSGIGAHAALMLNELGAKVIAIGRDENKLLTQKKQAKNSDNFITISKDLSNFEYLDKWTLELAKEHGEFNGAVLAAGVVDINPITTANFAGLGVKVFNINYFGNLQILKGLADKRAKSKENSSFIWISSIAFKLPGIGIANYAASKGAIVSAVKSFALEFAPKYRINAICPGFILTPMLDYTNSVIGKNYIDLVKDRYPLGIGTTNDTSNLICFLLSDASKWMTGQSIILDGGVTLT